MKSTHKNTHISSKAHGFTIVELAVVIVISLLLVAIMASFIIATSDSFAVGSIRGKLNNQLSTAINRIESDIQYSRYVLPQNTITDSAAPSGTNHWSSSDHQLVLGSTARRSDNTLLNTTDTVDNIVYYIKDKTLYRRLLANTTSGNRYTTITCAQTSQGGCNEDTEIAKNVKSFTIAYYTADGALTNDPAVAASVKYFLLLQTTQSHQVISASGTMQSNLLALSGQASSPIPSVSPLTAGYGGITLQSSSATIQNDNAFSYGTITVNGNSTLTANNLSTAHKNCGTASNYGTDCPASPAPINVTMSTINATSFCGPTMPVVQLGFSGTANGTQTTNCDMPYTLPTFNKKALVDTIPAANTSPGTSCAWGSNITISANHRYTGNVTLNTCTVTIQGGGVLYIEGDLTIGSNTSLKVASGVSDTVTIIVNGKVTTSMATIGDSFSTMNIISFYSSDSTCSNSSNCNNLDANGLYNSRNLTAVTIGSNSTNYANIYAPFAGVRIDLATQKSHVLYGQTVTINQTYNVTLTSS